jgi:hypothetical protein
MAYKIVSFLNKGGSKTNLYFIDDKDKASNMSPTNEGIATIDNNNVKWYTPIDTSQTIVPEWYSMFTVYNPSEKNGSVMLKDGIIRASIQYGDYSTTTDAQGEITSIPITKISVGLTRYYNSDIIKLVPVKKDINITLSTDDSSLNNTIPAGESSIDNPGSLYVRGSLSTYEYIYISIKNSDGDDIIYDGKTYEYIFNGSNRKSRTGLILSGVL